MATDPSEDVLFEAPPRWWEGHEAPVPVGKAKTYRPYDPAQSFLPPPSLDG